MVTTWDEALRLNGTTGYRRQDALKASAEMQAKRRAAAGFVERHWVEAGRETRTCGKHGEFVATLDRLEPALANPMFLPKWTICPTCDAEIAAESKADAPMSAEMKRELEHLRLAGTGMDKAYFGHGFGNYDHKLPEMHRVWSRLHTYAMELQSNVQRGRGIVLYGTKGTGKTHLACAILRHLVLRLGGTGRILTQAALISRLKATMNPEARERELDVFAAMVQPDLLVVDEIGRGSCTEWERAQLFRVIDERYRAVTKPTILITNLPLLELEHHVDAAGLDRMKQNDGMLIPLSWESRRRAIKNLENPDE